MESRIDNIVTKNNITTALFHTSDVAEANLLRRAILSEIETYAINYVIFQVNTSARHEEVLSLRLGQLPIDHSRYTHPQEGDFRGRIDVTGPALFTTNDIKDLPFKNVTPIIELREGQRILCDYIVTKGTGKEHAKWKPVSTCSFTQVNGGYQIRFVDVEMLSPEDIIRQGLSKMVDAANRVPSSLFCQVLVPANI